MDYYSLFDLTRVTFTKEILRKKWKEKCKLYHPDRLPEDQKKEGEEKFKEISEAYEILNDDQKRHIYDNYGKEGIPKSDFFQDNNQNYYDFSNLINFGFNNMYDNSRKKRRIPKIKLDLEMTLEELYMGKILEEKIERINICKICDASGFKDKKKHVCHVCNGSGILINNINFLQIRQNCPVCMGNGIEMNKTSTEICNNCQGAGIYKKSHLLNIKIEPGYKNGDILKIKNEGHEIKEHKKRGKIEIQIIEKKHPIFKRYNHFNQCCYDYDLMLEVELTLQESLCGFIKSFHHLDDREIFIKKSNIIQNGDIFYLENEGMPIKKTNKRGNLIIKFIVDYKKIKLDVNQKKKIYEIFQTPSNLNIIESSPNKVTSPCQKLKDIKNYNLENQKFSKREHNTDENINDASNIQCINQ